MTRVYGYAVAEEELLLPEPGTNRNRDLEDQLHCQRARSIRRWVAQLDGVFCGCLWQEDRLAVFTDRLGLGALYVSLRAGKWQVSHSFSALRRASAADESSWDEVQLSHFLARGRFAGNGLPIDGVYQLPPASILWLTDGEPPAVEHYWSWPLIDTTLKADDKRIASVAKAVAQEVARLPAGRPVFLPLSGGLDSRYLAQLLARTGATMTSVTYGDEDCSDVRLATAVAEALRLDHQHIPIEYEQWLDQVSGAIRRTEGLVSCEGLHPPLKTHTLLNREAIIVSGFAGDLVLGGSYVQWPTDGSEFKPDSDQQLPFSGVPYALQAGEISVDALTLASGPRRSTIAATRDIGHGQYYFPFIHRAVLEAVYRLPDRHRLRSLFYRKVLQTSLSPALLHVPWQGSNRPLTAHDPLWKRPWRSLRYRLVDRQRFGAEQFVNTAKLWQLHRAEMHAVIAEAPIPQRLRQAYPMGQDFAQDCRLFTYARLRTHDD